MCLRIVSAIYAGVCDKWLSPWNVYSKLLACSNMETVTSDRVDFEIELWGRGSRFNYGVLKLSFMHNLDRK
jgi:hypothetical protein